MLSRITGGRQAGSRTEKWYGMADGRRSGGFGNEELSDRHRTAWGRIHPCAWEGSFLCPASPESWRSPG